MKFRLLALTFVAALILAACGGGTTTAPGSTAAPAAEAPTAAPAAGQYLAYGAGPRASQYLVLGAKCHALIQGKYSPDIEDVRAMALPVLRHRILRNYKAEAEGVTQQELIKQLL